MTNLQKTKQAYLEIDAFINLLPEEEKRKIPKDMQEFFKTQKDKEYKKEIYINIPIEKQNLKEETLALIALLYIKYICENEEEKRNLEEIYAENERKYREEIKNKYSAEKVMQKRNEDCNKSKSKENRVANEREDKKQANEKYLVEYKESIFKKIINKIKKFLKRK